MKIPEQNAEQISNNFQKGYNINYIELKKENDQVVKLIVNIFKRHQNNSDISDPKDQELFAMLIEQELKLKKLIK